MWLQNSIMMKNKNTLISISTENGEYDNFLLATAHEYYGVHFGVQLRTLWVTKS